MASVSRDSGERAGAADKANFHWSGPAPLVTRSFRLSGGTVARLVVRDEIGASVRDMTSTFDSPRLPHDDPDPADIIEPGPRPVPVAHVGLPPVRRSWHSSRCAANGPAPTASRAFFGLPLTAPSGRTLVHMDPTPIRLAPTDG
jgi:hypothetical protein